MILKYENEETDYSHFSKLFIPLDRLKICTFKVNKNSNNIASKYIDIILKEAKINNIKEIYITVLDKYNDLIHFLLN